MAARSHHRGHKMFFDETTQLWRYEDDDTAVKDNWKNRTCGNCGQHVTKDGHDPCIGTLPGVINACCGHGDTADAYVIFDDDSGKSGADAIATFEMLKVKKQSKGQTRDG